MGHHATSDAPLNGIMDLHMKTLVTLVPKNLAVCFMQQGVKFSEV